MEMGKLILVANPGSSSRKYGLFRNEEPLATLHFETENSKVVCTYKSADGTKRELPCDFSNIAESVSHIAAILESEGQVTTERPLDAIAVRIVAPMDSFTRDRIVDDSFMDEFNAARSKAPLHIPVIASEIEHLRESFKDLPIIAVSDSAFHASKPELMKYYPFDTKLADKYDIKRYGYHGLSVGSIVHQLKQAGRLPEKLIVAHVGSGSSVTAVRDGISLDTSMGYTPLEGVMMATRSGSIDVGAAIAIKKALELDDDGLEKYLNKEAGMLGVSGSTNDMRDLIALADKGDTRAAFAYALYIYRVQSLIGQMAASLDGADAIVLTATILERNDQVRGDIIKKLSYLGFEIDSEINKSFPDEALVNIATEDSKPIYVIRTDETGEMLRRAIIVLESPND